MIYVNKLELPSEAQEDNFIQGERRTCFNTFYPFKIFANRGLKNVKFDAVTIFYGGNGSGKSTLINVLARKMKSVRYSDFNGAPFFDTYVGKCFVEYYKKPPHSSVLTSDDVFDYVLSARCVNESIDERRNALIKRYSEIKKAAKKDPKLRTLNGIDDLERWKETSRILSRKKSMSSYVRDNVERDVILGSNGETAMQYFVDRMDEAGVYLLDEPENSLSIEFQMQLVEYILATARATGTQFIIATHSPIFLSIKNARIYNLDAYPIDVAEWTELPNVRKYYDFFMQHREEFENRKEAKWEMPRTPPKRRLIGMAYSKRLESYSTSTIELISELDSTSIEVAIRASDVTTDADLCEDEVVARLKALKESYSQNRGESDGENFEDTSNLGVSKSSPYRSALMQMINYVGRAVGMQKNDQVLIVIKLDTEGKIKQWFEWINDVTDINNEIQASAAEIVRAAVKISNGTFSSV